MIFFAPKLNRPIIIIEMNSRPIYLYLFDSTNIISENKKILMNRDDKLWYTTPEGYLYYHNFATNKAWRIQDNRWPFIRNIAQIEDSAAILYVFDTHGATIHQYTIGGDLIAEHRSSHNILKVVLRGDYIFAIGEKYIQKMQRGKDYPMNTCDSFVELKYTLNKQHVIFHKGDYIYIVKSKFFIVQSLNSAEFAIQTHPPMSKTKIVRDTIWLLYYDEKTCKTIAHLYKMQSPLIYIGQFEFGYRMKHVTIDRNFMYMSYDDGQFEIRNPQCPFHIIYTHNHDEGIGGMIIGRDSINVEYYFFGENIAAAKCSSLQLHYLRFSAEQKWQTRFLIWMFAAELNLPKFIAYEIIAAVASL